MTDPTAHPHRGMITISIMLATVMQALDTTIANVALPHMQGSLQASQDQITWVLTSYIVAAAIATPLTGWMVGQWGRRRVFLVTVVGFTVASALCGMSTNVVQIVGARLLQGLFGAALIPLSQAVLLDINPREKVSQAMAIWGAGIMIGPILGPVLGGWLTDNVDWRWVFFINLPIGVLAFLGIARFLPESRPRAQPLDRFGFITLSLAIGGAQICLDRGEQQDWFNSVEIWIEAVVAVVALTYFIIHTATSRGPSFFNRQLMRDSNFVTGSVLGFIVGMILYATMALLPTFLQGLYNYPVTFAGEVMAPRGVGTMVAMLIVGRISNRVDLRTMMTLGFILMAWSLWQMTHFTLDMSSGLVVESGVIQGLGIGFTFVPLSAATFATLPAHLRHDGTPIYSLLRNIGSSIGISIVQALLTSGTIRAHAELATHVTQSNPNMLTLPNIWNPSVQSGAAALNAEVNRQAAMLAYLNDFQIMMYLTIFAMPLLLLVRKPGAQPVTAAASDAH
jgi:DHA2 family multidrug resistance protein